MPIERANRGSAREEAAKRPSLTGCWLQNPASDAWLPAKAQKLASFVLLPVYLATFAHVLANSTSLLLASLAQKLISM